MSEYYSTAEINLEDLSDSNITNQYNQGFLFTRVSKGNMYQTRSLRIDLSKFELNSENRRILRKNEELKYEFIKLPYPNYSWEIHKLGKTFYETKFGDSIMSASKIKELFTDESKSNLNAVFKYEFQNKIAGYSLCYVNDEIMHYAYPFYDLEIAKEQNVGMGMMLNAISWAKDNGKKYVYLGSVVESKSKYKLQFDGLEWWNETEWSGDLEKLKQIIDN